MVQLWMRKQIVAMTLFTVGFFVIKKNTFVKNINAQPQGQFTSVDLKIDNRCLDNIVHVLHTDTWCVND